MPEIKRNREYETKWSGFKDGKIILYLHSREMRVWVKCPITGKMADGDSCKYCGQKKTCGG